MTTPSSNNQKTITFRLVGIKDDEFHTYNLNELDETKVLVSYGWGSKIDSENKIFILFLSISFTYKKDDKEVPLLTYHNSNSFRIDNFNDIVTEVHDDKFNFPKEFLVMFLGIAISTARGILIVKTANTIFKDLFVPIVSHDILQEIALNTKNISSKE